MKLTQFGGDQLTQQVVTAMSEESNVLQFVEFYSITGNSAYTRTAASASGGVFRELNNPYTGVQAAPVYVNPTLTIFGDEVKVDQAHERRGMDIASERARQLIAFARNLGRKFQYYFVNGDHDTYATQFDGLLHITPSGQVITAATDGFTVPLGNSDAKKTSQQEFLEMLDNLIASVSGGAQFLLMPSAILSRLSRIAESQVIWQKDDFGKPLAFYNGVPLLAAGYNTDGNPIIPFTETCGGSSVTASVYAVRCGEGEKLSFATNVGLSVKDKGVVGNNYIHNIDFDLTSVLCEDKAVARLKGLKLS